MWSRARRQFLAQAGSAVICGLSAGTAAGRPATHPARALSKSEMPANAGVDSARLFLCGDVMTGRGVDQIMQHPVDPRLHEAFVKSARRYVTIAEEVSGPIPRNVAPAYIWGDALAELERAQPDARIVNLETAVTTSDEFSAGKGIHYRMHPSNVTCLTAAKLDCCVLANNHVLDWSRAGLRETVATLRAAGIRTAGAGDTLAQARTPAMIESRSGSRVLVFAYASASAGVPDDWVATSRAGGVNGLDESDPESIEHVARAVREQKRPGDVVVVSIHWGSNWGYQVPGDQRRLAHAIIDEAGADVVYGHSSHHPRPIEVYGGKLILYGCGDFINDYEGIGGYEMYRPELALMYLPTIERRDGKLRRLVLVPTRIQKFRVGLASGDEAEWLCQMLEREGRAFGTRVMRPRGGPLELAWS